MVRQPGLSRGARTSLERRRLSRRNRRGAVTPATARVEAGWATTRTAEDLSDCDHGLLDVRRRAGIEFLTRTANGVENVTELRDIRIAVIEEMKKRWPVASGGVASRATRRFAVSFACWSCKGILMFTLTRTEAETRLQEFSSQRPLSGMKNRKFRAGRTSTPYTKS